MTTSFTDTSSGRAEPTVSGMDAKGAGWEKSHQLLGCLHPVVWPKDECDQLDQFPESPTKAMTKGLLRVSSCMFQPELLGKVHHSSSLLIPDLDLTKESDVSRLMPKSDNSGRDSVRKTVICKPRFSVGLPVSGR